MVRIAEMLAGAEKDFALARRYKEAGEFTISVLLYTEAIEKIFKAIFIRRTGKEPPGGASIDYLAMRLHMPKEIFDDTTLQCVDEDEERVGAYETGKSAQERALDMEDVAKRLLDYGMACVRA
jgi:HEPN domain-containing protein